MRRFARAVGAARSGKLAGVPAELERLAALRDQLLAGKDAYWAEIVDIQRRGAAAWLAFAQGKKDEAIATLRSAADAEDATEKSAVTPGPLAPARELLGDLLLELGRPAEALAEYRATLRSEPNRYHTLDGARRAAVAAGDSRAEASYSRQLHALTGR
jgi:hypothetical protein